MKKSSFLGIALFYVATGFSQNILVVGGAGYIGSVTSYQLSQAGHKVVVLDNFLHNQHVSLPFATVVRGDMGNRQLLQDIFATHNIDAVMHFAARIEVGESVKDPRLFYENNVRNTLTLLDEMLKAGVKKIIFSSTCSVYGVPQKLPLTEDHPRIPYNPYGRTKLAVEHALEDYSRAYGLQYVILRYFNAAGALPDKGLGEQHDPETHVIPILLKCIRTGKEFTVFGEDYETRDGSCIRDYVHVRDIAHAHVLALEYLQKTSKSDCFNLGTGTGTTVKELAAQAQEVCGRKLALARQPRRGGDVPILVANAQKAASLLGWRPEQSTLKNILEDAQAWEEQRSVCK